MSKRSGVLLVPVVVLCFLSLGVLASSAAAAPVQCGDVITESIKLKADLTDCPDDGLVVGADRITIDLDGYEISGACVPNVNCAGRVGIDNSGGYDRVRIRNGTVRGFERTILLVGANRNTLAELEVRGGGSSHLGSTSIELRHADRNLINDSVAIGGDPAVLLVASDRNMFARTSIRGGVAVRDGDGLVMLNGSDANSLIDSEVEGALGAVVIEDSVRNSVRRSFAGAHAGAIILSRAHRSLIVGNELDGEQAWGVSVLQAHRNAIRDNHILAGIRLDGDRNLVVRNDLIERAFDTPPFTLVAGDRNVIRHNDAVRGSPWVIGIEAAATRTSLVGNSASDGTASFGPGNGIKVDAPGTLVRGNTANDNEALGIDAVDGVIDGGGNRASGNGDPRQCVGVVCTP